MYKKITSNLSKLYTSWSGNNPKKIVPIKAHGSERKYFRITGPEVSVIGAYNNDKSENKAFLSLSRHFHNLALPVPELYAENQLQDIYLIQDLGDENLFTFVNHIRDKDGFSKPVIQLYEKVIKILPKFQILASKNLDYSICYPRHTFDKQSMMWDLNYFKYYFLKLAKISFNEQSLEDDFQKFSAFLLKADCNYFLYRDFQSRNIMIHNNKPYFIDYQGGRKGALQYDIASLLYDSKADIPNEIRDHLLEKYIIECKKYIKIDLKSFMKYYHGYIVIRILQALGAYGFRGFYERKAQFLQSVPFAIKNLENLLLSIELPLKLPELFQALTKIIRSTMLRQLGDVNLTLTIRIQSFSYKHGIPFDNRGHGGGFVFDCRSLPNPGRMKKFAAINGNDKRVVNYLKKQKSVDKFLKNIYQIISQVISNYQQRNFTDLMIAFGCTGGQHRSVYCSNQLSDHLKKNFKVNVETHHLELEGL